MYRWINPRRPSPTHFKQLRCTNMNTHDSSNRSYDQEKGRSTKEKNGVRSSLSAVSPMSLGSEALAVPHYPKPLYLLWFAPGNAPCDQIPPAKAHTSSSYIGGQNKPSKGATMFGLCYVGFPTGNILIHRFLMISMGFLGCTEAKSVVTELQCSSMGRSRGLTCHPRACTFCR